MAHVALVQCPAWGALPPLGPAALKAYLQQHGHTARCFDFNIEYYNDHHRTGTEEITSAYGGADPWGPEAFDEWSLDGGGEVRFPPGSFLNEHPLPIARWADAVLAERPDIVGFTVYTTSLTASLQLAEEIFNRDPSVRVVFGGPSVAQDQDGERVLTTRIPEVVVDGEGEATLLAIAEAVDAGQDLREVAGLGMVVDGAIHWTGRRALIPKIDSLPFPDFTDFDWSNYPNPYLIPMMASRGCVLNCAFCYETVYWKRFRTQSPERIVDEIEHQVNNHPLIEQARAEGKKPYFMFADSLVNGHPGGLRRTCQLIVDRGIEIGWGGQATINTKMDREFFDLLAASGCTGLAFGLESGSQRVIESMGKHFHIDEGAGFIKRVHDAGITVTVNVMVGFPTETLRDFVDSLLFLARTRKWLFQVSNVTTTQIAAGSALAVDPERYGVVVHPDGSWESAQTGQEKDRRRRLKMLHLWMSLMRIPHQEYAR